jgi:hypothetical protein
MSNEQEGGKCPDLGIYPYAPNNPAIAIFDGFVG